MANWEYRIDLRRIWDEYGEDKIDAETAGKKVAEILKNLKMNAEIDSYLLDSLDEIIFSFEREVDSEEEFDRVMTDLYDWGDTDMPTPPGKMRRKLAWIATQF